MIQCHLNLHRLKAEIIITLISILDFLNIPNIQIPARLNDFFNLPKESVFCRHVAAHVMLLSVVSKAFPNKLFKRPFPACSPFPAFLAG